MIKPVLLIASITLGCGGLSANRTSDAGSAVVDASDAASDGGGAGADAHAPDSGRSGMLCGATPGVYPDVFPDGAPPWVTCSCPDAGCPAQTVCAFYMVPDGRPLPFGCAPVPSGCAGHATCACAGMVCRPLGCLDQQAGLLCD